MKKIILIAAVLLFITLYSPCTAQDTTTTVPPCSVDTWPQECDLRAWPVLFDSYLSFGKKYNVKGADLVGIAAYLITLPEAERSLYQNFPNERPEVYDSAFRECYEYFQLYVAHPDAYEMPNPYQGGTFPPVDTLEVIARAKMHVLDTNVIGYFDQSVYEHSDIDIRYITIRAAYFDTAITVNGDFWIGTTNYTCEKHINDNYIDSTGHQWRYYTWPIAYYIVQPAPWIGEFFNNDGDTVIYSTITPWWLEGEVGWQQSTGWYYCIFPLFCKLPVYPSPLVLEGSGGGSADVVPVLSASDFVVLSPNPAVTEVTVSSSTGVGRLRVYDVNGGVVYETRGEGLQHTIPVATWPAGVYVVHVDTPLGLAVKKFEKAK